VLRADLEGCDRGGGGGKEVQEGGDICIHVADSLPCTAEMNNNLVRQISVPCHLTQQVLFICTNKLEMKHPLLWRKGLTL